MTRTSPAALGAVAALLALPAGTAARPAHPGLPEGVRAALVYRLTVSPIRPHAGQRTRFRFIATVGAGGPASGLPDAKVRFGGRTAVTTGRGRATIRTTLKRSRRRYRATLSFAGKRVATATVLTR
jgi:hypothetical protein